MMFDVVSLDVVLSVFFCCDICDHAVVQLLYSCGSFSETSGSHVLVASSFCDRGFETSAACFLTGTRTLYFVDVLDPNPDSIILVLAPGFLSSAHARM